MKKRGILSLFLAGIIGSSLLLAHSGSVAAASCSNISSFGAVTLRAPDLSNIQNQSLWVRLQGQSGSKVLVEVNESECHEVTIGSDSTDAWTWQTLESSGQPQQISFPSASGNTFKLIGVSSGVRLDRVLIANADCVPQDYGNNCQSSVSLKSDTGADSIAVPSPAGPVSGKVHISPTVQQEAGQVTSLTYSVNGDVLQKETTAAPFDTTLLKNGRYTVHTTLTLKDGSTIREVVVVDIKNPENALTPLVRWAKQGRASLRIIGITLAGILVLLVIIKFIIGKRRTRRERTFRGL